MTDQIQLYKPTAQLLNAQSQSEINKMAMSIQKFAPGGASLSNTQAALLAVYSIMVDANPYAGESFMTSQGPMLGIPLYRRKAKEYNRIMGGDDNWDYTVSYREASDSEANFDPTKGDVAWVCELTDTKAKKEWEDTWTKFFNLLIEAGADYKEASKRADMMAGKLPTWEAVGVVAGSEKFSKVEYDSKTRQPSVDEEGNVIYKPEMFDRNERAKKRAEKLALKKRYPDMLIPEGAAVQADPEVKVLIKNAEGYMEEAEAMQKDKIKNLNPDKVLQELGYGGNQPEVIEAEATDVEGPDPLWKEYSEDVINLIANANVGVKDHEKIVGLLNRSKIVSPHTDSKYLVMYASFYCQARKKGKDQDQANEDADQKLADLMSQEQE